MDARRSTLKIRVVPSERRNDPFALLLVAVVCIGLLFVVFAPRGTFTTGPASAQLHR